MMFRPAEKALLALTAHHCRDLKSTKFTSFVGYTLCILLFTAVTMLHIIVFLFTTLTFVHLLHILYNHLLYIIIVGQYV